jgi:putative membrane-bound dehydrogenase-like protein
VHAVFGLWVRALGLSGAASSWARWYGLGWWGGCLALGHVVSAPDPQTGGAAAGQALLQVPEGFVIERVAGPPDLQFPMFGALDDKGWLYVTESSGGDLYRDLVEQNRGCRVRLLEDRDGDGVYERVGVFAEGFVPSMGLVWHHGRLYVADPPDLVVLEDTTGDGKADRRSVVLSGFGHTDNGSLHGLIFGPDGWLYLTMGWPDGYRLPRGDGTWVSGTTGALLRCRPDGTQVQALSRGFDQLIEVVFLPGGEIIGSQTWYQDPGGGLRDSLTHIMPGGVYPQRWATERPRLFTSGVDPLPPLLMLPAVAHSGITLYRGTQFPVEWRRQLFSAQFNTRKVVGHPLLPAGSTFASASHDFVTTDDPDFRPSDVLEDADGSLLVIDTGSWYVQHCPTGRMRDTAAPGGIYRVRALGSVPAVDLLGSRLRWEGVELRELTRRLADERPAVRDRAVEQLVGRGAGAVVALSGWLDAVDQSAESRALAIWALARVGTPEAVRALRAVIGWSNDSRRADPLVLAAAARALGEHADQAAAPALARLLQHPEGTVQLAAAEALASCNKGTATPALIDALADGPDRLLEHALIYALHRTAHTVELRQAIGHPSPNVQAAMLMILDQAPHRALKPSDVLSRISSTHARLRGAARFCLQHRPEWADHTLSFVQAQLRSGGQGETDTIGWVELLVGLQLDGAVIEMVGEALVELDDRVPPRHKLGLIEFLEQRTPTPMPEAWQQALGALLDHALAEVRLRAVQALAATRLTRWQARLERMAADEAEDTVVRIEALEAMARFGVALPTAGLGYLLGRLAPSHPAWDRLRAAEVLASTPLSTEALDTLVRAAAADATIPPGVVLGATRRSGVPPSVAPPLFEYLAAAVERGWPVTEEQLTAVFAAVSDTHDPGATALREAVRDQAEQQRALLRQFEPLLRGGDPVAGRAVFFGKAACYTCHPIGQEGRPVGPDLTRIGAIRSGPDLLESVLLPSATFAQGYESYAIELKDGDEVTGTLARETSAAVILRTPSGAERVVPRSEMVSLTRSPLSVMPEGLLQALTREEAADLFAFLQELK